jgi:hypothetical protein
MRSWRFVTILAATVAAAASMPSLLWAHDNARPRGDGGSMMGSGMGQMMDHCSQMMQGNSSRPNEQWRDNPPPANGRTERKW